MSAMETLGHAFKEWAVICRALAEGKQALILRKGGIREEGGEFTLEHRAFWLFPTYVHQQTSGVRPEAAPLLAQAEADKLPPGRVVLSHWVEVTAFCHIESLDAALSLKHLHLWSETTVRQRFEYRRPGLNAFSVRVYRAAHPHEIVNTPEYDGCKSWVELDETLSTAGSMPVLSDAEYRVLCASLETRFGSVV